MATTPSTQRILRVWIFWIRDAIEDECRADLEATVLASMRSAPGNEKATALFRFAGDGTFEVSVASVWQSMDHVRAFAGEDYLQPQIQPDHLPKVFDRECTVRHYTVGEAWPVLNEPEPD